MPSLEFSQLVVSAAITQIADSAGASADAEMLGRALISLNAATKHFNSRQKWNWLWTEAPVSAVVAPFGVAVTASSGQTSATAGSGHGILVDDWLAGSGISLGARVSATAAGGFGITPGFSGLAAGNQSFTVTVNRDFYGLPGDWKSMYSARLLTSNRPLYSINRRSFDRNVSTEYTASTPNWYDTFQIAAKGKLRLIPSPNATDVLELRYFRAMATASASGTTSTLDIPSDYDPYLMAWAKWHFLTDKGEERRPQSETWMALAKEGLTTMLREQADLPDEAPGFIPGALVDSVYPSDNSTRYLGWTYSY